MARLTYEQEVRICFLSRKFPPTLSGMSTYALNLTRALIRRGHQLSVIAQYRPMMGGTSCYGDGPPIPLAGAEVIGVPQVNEVRSGDFEADIQMLVEKVEEVDVRLGLDVIHAQYGYPPGLAAILAGLRRDLPVVVSLQGGDGHWFGTCCREHFEVMKWLLGTASAVLYPTESFRSRVDERYQVAGNHRVVPGAVDTSLFKHDPTARMAWRQRLGLSKERLAVVYHGRLDNRKGVRELIDGFCGSSEAQARGCLIVAGIGPDAEDLAVRAKGQLAPDLYRWLGQVPYEEVPGLLSAGDLHCSPTYQEGFSNTLAEAAACHLPLLTTDTVGVRDVFRHGETAWLVPIENSASVAAGLTELMRDEPLRRGLADQAHAMVAERYSWERLAEELEGVYRASQRVRGSPPILLSQSHEPCRYRQNPVLL